jgi:hypothetical protein
VTITATPVTKGPRVFPHVTEIKEWEAQQSVRLLWDRIHDLEERLQAATATITQLVDGHNTNADQLAGVTQDAQTALAIAQRLGGIEGTGADGGGGGGGSTPPDGGDGGGGTAGCASAGATGHDTGGLLDAVRAGQIICGTGNEWSALKNVTADQATRDTNTVELLRRMIWHLQQAGFTSGRQKNPSGAISKDKLCVVVSTVLRVYDIFPGVDYTQPLTTQMLETAPAVLIDDAGIPD